MRIAPLRCALWPRATTYKDHWRQVLAEADRIGEKHLLTEEPAISRAQTAEMQAQKLRLVLPKPLHETYHDEQRDWILNVAEFLQLAQIGEWCSSASGESRSKAAPCVGLLLKPTAMMCEKRGVSRIEARYSKTRIKSQSTAIVG